MRQRERGETERDRQRKIKRETQRDKNGKIET